MFIQQSRTKQVIDTEISIFSSSSSSLLSSSCASPISLSNISINIHNEKDILRQHGYARISKLCDTQQGELFEAAVLRKTNKKPTKKVIIKKVSKSLHSQRIATPQTSDDDLEDGFTFCIPKNIVKEAFISEYLTVINRCNYILQYVDSFECDYFYYLVTEHLGKHSMNLKQFVHRAHDYLSKGRLSSKEYSKVIKYIFWQLMVCVHWLHNDVKCCHLDLKLEHVLLKDACFILDPKTNMIVVKRSICVKLCDFGSAEMFKNDIFECDKEASLLTEEHYKSPLLSEGQSYDARKADIWALGIMLFHCFIGRPLYRALYDEGYLALTFGEIETYLKLHNLRKYVKRKPLQLLLHMLNMNERKRFQSMNILNHQWFETYYDKYKDTIAAKSNMQKLQHLKMQQIANLKHFPFYRHRSVH